jgi:hypothetical protein
LDPDLPRPGNLPSLVGTSVTALSKTAGKPYYREVQATPKFEFTDLPYEAEIEITAAKEGWDRSTIMVTTGVQADRKSITLGMRRIYYGF